MDHDTKVRRGPRYSPPKKLESRADGFGPASLEADLEASIAAIALNQACGGSADVAWTAGVDDSTARRWLAGGQSNPANRTARMIDRAKKPFAMCGFFLARAHRALIVNEVLPEWKWRSMVLEAIRAEARPDGEADVVEAELLTGKSSLLALFEATAKHVAAMLYLMALLQVGMIRKYTLNGPRAH